MGGAIAISCRYGVRNLQEAQRCTDGLEDDDANLTPEKGKYFRALSQHGLALLFKLPFESTASSIEDLALYFACIAAFSSSKDTWNSKQSHQTSSHLLTQLRTAIDEQQASDVLAEVLRRRVKPAFAKDSKPQPGSDIEPKPWKTQHVYMPTVLHCILNLARQVDNDEQTPETLWFRDEDAQRNFVHANWPLLVPSILTLIDDPSMKYKTAGCLDLRIFLSRIKGETIERTGLGEIFEKTLLQCLSNLPSLTKEDDSIMLLDEAYPALMELTDVRFKDRKGRKTKVKSFDKIMHQGILRGFSMAGEHVRVAELLSVHAKRLVREMGIDSAPYLKVSFPAQQ